MRLKKYINEVGSNTTAWVNSLDVLKAADMVKKNCRPFLSQVSKCSKWGDYIFTRSIGRNFPGGKVILQKRVRQDRRPSDTPEIVHNYINDELEKKFGWRPREQAAFTFSHYVMAEVGYSPMFFPIGKFEIVWHPKIRDLYTHAIEDIYIENGQFDKSFIDRNIEGYKEGDLCGALRSRNEVMFRCKTYYLVSPVTPGASYSDVQERYEAFLGLL